MDDELQKAIHNLAVEAERLGTAFCESVCEFAKALSEAFADFGEMHEESIEYFATFIDEVIQKLHEREKERGKWRYVKSVPIRPLLLYKRGKVYRCRNNC